MKIVINFLVLFILAVYTPVLTGQNVTVLPDGKFGIKNNSPVEQFQIGDKWTFHNGGVKFIGYNVYWDDSDKRLFSGSASQIRFEENQLRFLVAPSGGQGSLFNPVNEMTLSTNGRLTVRSSIFTEKNGMTLRILPANPTPEIGSSFYRLNFWHTNVGWNWLYAKKYVKVSDRRLKTNIGVIEGALNKVLSLNGVAYNYKESEQSGFDYGFIAQDVEKVIPEIVSESKETKAIDYDAIIPFLVESIKEQQKEIERLKSELEEIKRQ